VGYVDYDSDNFEVKTKFITWNMFTPVDESARFQVETFPIGSYNIGIFGVWGWDEYPEPIKYLQGRLIQKILKDESFANKLRSEKVGNYSYNLLTDKKGYILGDMELDLIIKQYTDWGGYAVV
jgi:hypothetical protein